MPSILDEIKPDDWDFFPDEIKDILACLAEEARLVADPSTPRERLLKCKERLEIGSKLMLDLSQGMKEVFRLNR